MKDLTDGSIAKNILQIAVLIAAGMFLQVFGNLAPRPKPLRAESV